MNLFRLFWFDQQLINIGLMQPMDKDVWCYSLFISIPKDPVPIYHLKVHLIVNFLWLHLLLITQAGIHAGLSVSSPDINQARPPPAPDHGAGITLGWVWHSLHGEVTISQGRPAPLSLLDRPQGRDEMSWKYWKKIKDEFFIK